MFGLELLSTEMLGVLAAAVAGLLTLIPTLGMTDQRRALVAIVTIIVAVFAQNNFVFVSWSAFGHDFMSAAVYALVAYKLLLQSVVLPSVDKTLSAIGVKAKYRG